MDEVEISVIVPVYNASSYIDRCVQSLLKQETQYSFEILFVDDGSEDDSLNKLRKWQNIDGRLRLFTQINSGVSTARNKGLDAAKGKYAVFVDSDDWVSSRYLEDLRDAVIDGKSGLVFSGHVKEKECKSEVVRYPEGVYMVSHL